MSDHIDLSEPRLLTEAEVASLFHITIRALRYRLTAGKFPVSPKTRRPKQWSATELKQWLEDGRKRAL